MEMDTSWDAWKKTLAQAVGLGEKMGLDQTVMARRAEQVGDYLAKQVDPANPQQRLLQELWEAGDQEEQRALASMIIKLVDRAPVH